VMRSADGVLSDTIESTMRLQTEDCHREDIAPRPTLVLGLGNILLRDEGLGVRVVEAMGHMTLPKDVELFDGATAGLDLLDVLANRRKVIVIDAVDCDADPGTVLRLTPQDLVPRHSQDISLHDLGLLETLAAAGHLGVAPEEVIILGVRPGDVSCGLTLSATIAAMVPKIVHLVLAELGVSNGLCPMEMTTASCEMGNRP